MPAPLLYNLFPRLAGTLERWPEHASRARALGFTHLFLNPVTRPGFSGSLYAVREHDRVCPDFLPPGASADGLVELGRCLARVRDLGLVPVMDLVINHVAIDSPLLKSHPDWFRRDERGEVVRPSAIDPADARKVTVWGDLAEVDNQASPDREALWDYWREIVAQAVHLGFGAFRCDAAYKVPTELWRLLGTEARRLEPGAQFFAETLGCRLEEVRELAPAGFDYLFNSSKYWAFDAPWALTQHAQFGALAPSISFPESHDTPRLMAETGGNLAVQRQRYLLAAVFSEGLLMPVGYEFGFRRSLDVVRTRPEDWEETGVDLGPFVRSVNRLKQEHPLLAREGHLRALGPFARPGLALEKVGDPGGERLLVLINKDWNAPQEIELSGLSAPDRARLLRIRPDGSRREDPLPGRVALDAAEIALVVGGS
jgi:starch synthase (maltosyl-transferring)